MMDRSNSDNRVNGVGRRVWRLAFSVVLLVLSCGGAARAESAVDREYKVKAAFVYNVLKFVDGGRFAPPDPKDKSQADSNDVLVIGVLGAPPSRQGFEELVGRRVGDRRVRIHWFNGIEAFKDEEEGIPERHPDLDRLRRCHVLFICPSEKAHLHRVLPHIQKDGILTVGDVPGFLEAGGVMNFLLVDKKVRFEINLAAAARAKLVIRSSLLRLAVRTLEHDRLEPQQDEENSGGTGRR